MQILMRRSLPDRWSGRGASGRATSSRPPVMPARPEDQHERHQRADDDEPRAGGQVDREAADVEAVLGLGEQRVEAADRQRADDRAPEARHAADHEHREGDEREIEVHRLRVDRQQVDVEPAGEPRERAGERERDQPLPVDRDADRTRCRGDPRASRAGGGRSGSTGSRRRRRSRAGRRAWPAAGRSSRAPRRTCSSPGPIFS